MIRNLGILFFLLTSVFSAQVPSRPSIRALLEPPVFNLPKISPDGKQLAMLTNSQGKKNLMLLDLATMQPKPIADLLELNVVNYWWKGNDHMLLLLEKTPKWHEFYLFSLKGPKPYAYSVLYSAWDIGDAKLVSMLPGNSNEVLVANRYNNASGYTLRRLNVQTGKFKTVQSDPGGAEDWFANNVGQPLAATAFRDKHWVLLVPSTDGKRWEEHPIQTDGHLDIWPMAVHPDQQRLIIFNYATNGPAQVAALDLKTWTKTPLFQPTETDPEGVIAWAGPGTRPRAVGYETDRPRLHFLDDEAAQVMAAVNQALPDSFNRVESASLDESRMVIFSSNDNDPGAYYLLDRTIPRLTALVKRMPALDPRQLGRSHWITSRARDGLVFTGQLVLPPGPVDTKPPLIVLVGPSINLERTNYLYDEFPRVLAAQGYAVARFNYRGTGGFGRQFEAAGDQQIGQSMPDDIIDGTQQLTDSGLVDSSRVALLGRGHGGIVAMHALARTTLFSVWINYDTPMSAGWLRSDELEFSRRFDERHLAMSSLARGTSEYLKQLDPLKLLPSLRMPSFSFYSRSLSDNTLIYDGAKLRAHFGDSSPGHVFIKGAPFLTAKESTRARRDHLREDRIKFFEQLMPFLEKHLAPKFAPVPVAK